MGRSRLRSRIRRSIPTLTGSDRRILNRRTASGICGISWRRLSSPAQIFGWRICCWTTTVTNLVVTTNFDDFLSQALSLFGRRHIVCDHPRTLERIDLRSPDVQIIHIHGSYWFYDCCNLNAEISERAKGSSSTSFTMLSTLDDILRTHSPLVVGYSGWEGDVFMNALQRRMSAPLRTKSLLVLLHQARCAKPARLAQDQPECLLRCARRAAGNAAAPIRICP